MDLNLCPGFILEKKTDDQPHSTKPSSDKLVVAGLQGVVLEQGELVVKSNPSTMGSAFKIQVCKAVTRDSLNRPHMHSLIPVATFDSQAWEYIASFQGPRLFRLNESCHR